MTLDEINVDDGKPLLVNQYAVDADADIPFPKNLYLLGSRLWLVNV